MKFWKQLRWKIIGGHMLVVLVGVLTLSFVSEIIRLRTMPTVLQPHLAILTQAETPAEIERTIASLIETFYRDAISRSLLIAALSAIVTGLLTSLFLAREILRPLWQLASTSQRIAGGRYSERINVPASTELALVATSFNQMAEVLEQVEQQRVALINNVAHELRTPLTGLEGYLEGLMDGLFTGTPETFAQMSQEVRRLHRLVDDLQALSLVEAGQISLHLETFDLIPLVERIAAQLKPQAMAQCLEIITEHHHSKISVYADPDRTAQVIVNLVGNAIRYTPDGGCITVRVGKADGLARVEVQDNGIGIPAEALPYLFERFYRVDRSRSRHSGGSGIGLTIARHLAWAMAGDLTAASPGPGQGSTFTFTLPLTLSSTHPL
ncbi:MAG: ATP-binding protein [Anaerolineae bacterium]|nr:ATP-binding protein [Anaerolineae bacterium]